MLDLKNSNYLRPETSKLLTELNASALYQDQSCKILTKSSLVILGKKHKLC